MPAHPRPRAVLEEVNRQLCTQVFNGQFVTMLILVLDVDNEQRRNRHGRPPAADHVRTRRPHDLPIEPQLVLGVERTSKYPTERFTCSTRRDARALHRRRHRCRVAPEGKRFTVDGLRQSLERGLTRPVNAGQPYTAPIERFRTGRDLSDDLTLVAIQFEPGLNCRNQSNWRQNPRFVYRFRAPGISLSMLALRMLSFCRKQPRLDLAPDPIKFLSLAALRRFGHAGAIVKWDHATMAWLNLGFKSPWLHSTRCAGS